MKWPGFLQKLLGGCFGHSDEPKDAEVSETKKTEATVQAHTEVPDRRAQNEANHAAAGAESSRTTSDQPQSDQSHNDANQLETQPTSVGSGSKGDTDPDEITATKSSPPAPDPSADPDAITPVESPTTKYVSVKEALEDRRKLYERLRGSRIIESPSMPSQSASPPPPIPQADAKQPAVEMPGQS